MGVCEYCLGYKSWMHWTANLTFTISRLIRFSALFIDKGRNIKAKVLRSGSQNTKNAGSAAFDEKAILCV